MLHIPPTNLLLLAAKQEPSKKSLSLNEKYWKNFLEKVQKNGQSEKTQSCLEKFGMKYRQKGHKDRNRHKNRIKRSGQAQLVYVKDMLWSLFIFRRHSTRKTFILQAHTGTGVSRSKNRKNSREVFEKVLLNGQEG